MKLLTYKNQALFEHPILLDQENPKDQVILHCLLGATAIHLVLLDDNNEVQLHAEILAEDDEELLIEFIYQEDHQIEVTCEGRQVYLLSIETLEKINQYYTINPILINQQNSSLLDIVLIIDGTNHLLKATNEKYPITWQQLHEKVQEFIAQLANKFSTRVGILAFADQEPPEHIRADALKPLYHLKPDIKKGEEFSFIPFNQKQLEQQIQQIQSSSGCDYIDAVADAFEACQHFNWRQKARRLIILMGDSPGHSILHPIAKGGDINIRKYDVEVEALKLHQQKIEIITLYIQPLDKKVRLDVINYSQKQYKKLASLPCYTFQDIDFEADIAINELEKIEGLIGRNAMFGEIIDIE